MTMVKVRSCLECPFFREDGQPLGLSDVCGVCCHPVEADEWPPVLRPREAPPKWCPLREREAIVAIGGV